ncbi:MAG: pyridoxamine 5'-phosphate oxidase [Chloroflexi bacterium]|nr:pyridoxamine 5'-phosphate oxidase [Chloroflexota bacterium]|tara:strand:- start:144 stop:611 length:468 start_codon:yes stop_codon:yes gene_type:complete
MVNKRKVIELSHVEIQNLLRTERVLQVASINKDGTPHLAPMWFVLEEDDSLVFTTYGRSQKVKNLERDPRVTLLVECGEMYDELRGVAIDGVAEIVRDPSQTANVMELTRLKDLGLGLKREPSNKTKTELPPAAYKRVVVRVFPKRYRSWDHSKI